MNKVIMIAVFLLIPIAFAFSQDNNAVKERETKNVKSVMKQVACPECQGWGWLVGLTYQFGKLDSKSTSSDGLNRNNRFDSMDLQLQRVKCYHCGGSGKVYEKVQVK
jgi:DnaJ-class molecular chaperone